ALLKATGDAVNERDPWLSQALYGAITRHEDEFFNIADMQSASSFTTRILESLSDEHYVVGRRSRFQFSPDVSNKEIHIQTEVRRRDNEPYNGLIVGQGDKDAGYALFMKNNRLFFVVHQHGQTATVASRGNAPSHFAVDARMTADASIELLINGVSQGKAKAMHLFAEPLKLPLRSSEDVNDESAFTDYGGSSRFTGAFDNILVRLIKASRLQPRVDVVQRGDNSAGSAPSARI